MINDIESVVLLSTFNGEKYLYEFLDSLYKQSYKNFSIFVRDDGSTDGTLEIIQGFSEKFERLEILNSDRNVGVNMSYSYLLNEAKKYNFKYFLFADQDDIWLENKIELSIEKLKKIETLHKNLPILVHSDLVVTDEKLEIVCKSFLKYQKLNPYRNSLNGLLVQNNVTGCTMAINRELADLIQEIPQEAIMHDWWISLVAASFGEIHFINTQTIQYRQHSNNTIGAIQFNMLYLLRKIRNYSFNFEKYKRQGKAFYQAYSSLLDHVGKKTLINFISLFEKKPRILRIYAILRFGFFKHSFLRNLGWFYYLIKK